MENSQFELPNINHVQGFSIDIFGENTIINSSKYFICKYGELPHRFQLRGEVDADHLIDNLKKIEIKEGNYIVKDELANTNLHLRPHKASSNYLIFYKEKILIEINRSIAYIIYGKNVSIFEIRKIIDFIDCCTIQESPPDIFYMLVKSSLMPYGMDIAPFSIKQQQIDLQTNYNEDFLEVHEKIFSFLKTKNENGIVLLHGLYGTGKTTYLRYLINKANEKVIFMPFNMVANITDPYFLAFLKEHTNSILVIEDCDDLLCSRENGKFSNQGLSTLLNMGDGLLGDALNIKVICTFNTDLKNIDNAVLRKGRLVARYEFKELQISKAQQLSDKLGNNCLIQEPMTLSQIYGLKQQDFGKQENRLKLGFKAA